MHRCIFITQGMLWLRLGKIEYVFKAGDICWIPAHCLAGVSFMPQTQCLMIEISTRLNIKLPTQAGKFTANPLLQASLERLIALSNEPSSENNGIAHLSTIYQLIRYEFSEISPELDLLETVEQWRSQLTQLEQQQIDKITIMRQAIAAKSSGKTTDFIVDSLYEGDFEQYQHDLSTLLNVSL